MFEQNLENNQNVRDYSIKTEDYRKIISIPTSFSYGGNFK